MPRLRPAVQIGLVLGVAVVGLASALRTNEEPKITAEAYAVNGRQVNVDCQPAGVPTGPVRAWRITATNSVPQLVIVSARVRDHKGEALSNQVTTEINSSVQDVTIHLRLSSGVFVSDRKEHGDTLMLELGDMAFGEEKVVSVYVRR